MDTPSSYQQPLSPAPPYYPPVPPQPRESARKLALGVLNVFFGYVYLVLAISALVGRGLASYDMAIGDILQLVGWGWAGIALFWGGILLLRGSTSGVGMIKSAFWVILVTFGISLCAIIAQVASRYHGALIVSYLTLIALSAFYPLIANIVAGKLDDEYSL